MADAPVFNPGPRPETKKPISYAPDAVTRRLLGTKQAKALKLGTFGLWSQLATAYGIDRNDLIVAAIATGARPNRGDIEGLAQGIDGAVKAGTFSNIGDYLSTAFTNAGDAVAIYKAAKVPQGKYVVKYAKTPAQSAAGKVEDAAAVTALKTSNVKWITYDPKSGKIGTADVTDTDPLSGLPTNPPKNGLYYGQTPVTTQVFGQALQDLSDHFAAYGADTGKGVNIKDPRYAKQVAKFLYQGLTPTAIDNALAKLPGFTKSRAWKASAPAIIAQSKAVFGEGWSPSKNPTFIKAAIVGNWSQSTILAKLKERPEYLGGPVYRQQTAGLNNIHMSIMGSPSQQDQINIHEAAMEGWSPDQYAAWVRSTDAYKYSPEAKAYSIGLAQQLGLLTGSQGLVPVNAPGGAPQPKDSVPLPNSPRIAGTPTKTPAPPPISPKPKTPAGASA